MTLAIARVQSKPTWNVVGDAIRPLVQTDTHELFELSGPEGSGPPPHSHPWNESYVILEGEVLVVGEGEEHRVGPGTTVQIPAGTVHCYRILSPTARLLVTTSGTGAGRFFADVDSNLPPGPPTPADMPTLVAVARRNLLDSPLFPPS